MNKTKMVLDGMAGEIIGRKEVRGVPGVASHQPFYLFAWSIAELMGVGLSGEPSDTIICCKITPCFMTSFL